MSLSIGGRYLLTWLAVLIAPGLVLAGIPTTTSTSPSTSSTTSTSTSTTTSSTVPFAYGAQYTNDVPDDFYGPSTLYRVDLTTGAATLVGPIGAAAVSSMALHPTTDVLYGVGLRQADLPNTFTSILLTIDPATGVGTEVGPTGIGEDPIFESQCAGLAFRSDGALFCYAEAGDTLVTLNPATGAATLVGKTNSESCCGNGIAFDATDTLLHVSDSVLNSLDQATGQATMLANVTFPSGPDDSPRLNSLDISPSGIALGFLENGDKQSGALDVDTYLAAVDDTTGVVQCIAPTEGGLEGFAIPPGVDLSSFTPGDCAKPTCMLTTVDLGGDQAQWSIQDTGSGLDQINVLQSSNAMVNVPVFSSGDTSPVIVTATAIAAGAATVQLEALDVAGNRIACDAVDFNVDVTDPTCTVRIDKSSGSPVVALVQDTGSGIATIDTTLAVNVDLTIPVFTPGETGELELRAGQMPAGAESRVRFRVTDMNGNQRLCSQVTFNRLEQNGNGTTRFTFLRVDGSQGGLEYWNGSPGYDRARATVGRFRSRVDLASSSTFVNISGGLSPGDNEVKVQAWGRGGPSMLVTFSPDNLTAY